MLISLLASSQSLTLNLLAFSSGIIRYVRLVHIYELCRDQEGRLLKLFEDDHVVKAVRGRYRTEARPRDLAAMDIHTRVADNINFDSVCPTLLYRLQMWLLYCAKEAILETFCADSDWRTASKTG